jgi:hypothetical protein
MDLPGLDRAADPLANDHQLPGGRIWSWERRENVLGNSCFLLGTRLEPAQNPKLPATRRRAVHAGMHARNLLLASTAANLQSACRPLDPSITRSARPLDPTLSALFPTRNEARQRRAFARKPWDCDHGWRARYPLSASMFLYAVQGGGAELGASGCSPTCGRSPVLG